MQQQLLQIHRLVLYRKLLDDPVIQNLQKLQHMLDNDENDSLQEIENCYFDIAYRCIQQVASQQLQGNVWKNYVLQLIIEDENVFSLACERSHQKLSENLSLMASHDLERLLSLYHLDWEQITKQLGFDDMFQDLNMPGEASTPFQQEIQQKLGQLGEVFSSNVSLQENLDALIGFYHTCGCGIMGRYAAFRWENGLCGIKDPDKVSFSDLVGYDYQKELLIANTRAFVEGKKANNVLLYGAKGTGKSSSIKALLNTFASQGLRIIELSKMQLMNLNQVIRCLQDRGQRFILFIDDLSFEDFEVEYKYIKASLEGSLESKPDNVLIYVSSNRRHLIKENWSDRQRSADEVHGSDSEQEKLSFADRFGITITYYSPNQEQYLQIVEELARKSEISLPPEELRRQAIQWELNHNGRSGRTAQQFITFLSGQ